MRLHVAEPGIRDRIVEIPADVVFMNQEEDYVEEIDPLVTAGSDISPDELARLIHRAFFSPSDDIDADSHETQKIRFEQDATRIALTLLASRDEALKHAIAEAIRREVLWAMPRDREVGVTVKDGKIFVHFVPRCRAPTGGSHITLCGTDLLYTIADGPNVTRRGGLTVAGAAFRPPGPGRAGQRPRRRLRGDGDPRVPAPHLIRGPRPPRATPPRGALPRTMPGSPP